MWSISPRTSPHVASLNVSTEHTNLPRSYPHVRVTEYEPPRSYHHMSTTIHEPIRSWYNIFPIQAKHHYQLKTTHTTCDLMHGRLAHQPAPPGETGPDRRAVHARRQAPALFQRHCFSNTAWRSTSLPPGATRCRDIWRYSNRLAHSLVPPGATPVVCILSIFSHEFEYMDLYH